MAEHLKVARLYFVILGVFAVGRWLQGTVGHAPYDKAHHVFSIVILSWTSAFYYGAFCRRWRGYRLGQVAVLALVLALASQVVILLATMLSYALGIDTFFTHPRALNTDGPVPFGRALVIRLSGLVANCVISVILGTLGWAMGALLPEPKRT